MTEEEPCFLNGQTNNESFGIMECYKKGLEYAQAGQYQQALNLMQEQIHKTGGDAQVLNDTGAILHCLGRTDEAVGFLERARNMHRDSAEIIWNLVEAYIASGRPAEAVKLFDDMDRMEILNVDIMNRTASLFLDQGNKTSAIEVLLRSMRIWPEQEILSPMIHVIRSKRPKVAFFCGGDGMNFLYDIYEFINKRFEVRIFDGQSEDELSELMKWSDISWFEWCTNLAVIGSRQPKVCKNIIRLHRYEAAGPWPEQICWPNVDTLITVGNSFVMNTLKNKVPDLENQTSVVSIPNGVDLEKSVFCDRQRGKNIAFLANIRAVKNPALLLQCMQKLHFIDPEYCLFFAGRFDDRTIEQYIRHMILAMNLQDVVFFDGWQDDVCAWLEDKHYIVSTSFIESQGMGILEAMACGLKPVVHNFPGADQTFPPEYLFNISEEFCEQICSDSYEPQKYRSYVEENYGLGKQLVKINDIFVRLEKEIDSGKNREYSIMSLMFKIMILLKNLPRLNYRLI
ncbi:glycosyltransferase [Planctomycetota bacterium]